jgi:hypothetical protein
VEKKEIKLNEIIVKPVLLVIEILIELVIVFFLFAIYGMNYEMVEK